MLRHENSSQLVLAAGLSLFPLALSHAADADNSGNNQTDQNKAAVTPEKQSNAEADVAVTRAIRRAIVKDSSFSVYAHNIKIITTTEHAVYLRGAISSSDDVDKIVSVAKTNSNGYAVNNQLSVTK